MIIFYARCSTAEQNEARQLGDAHACHAEKIYIDKASGKNRDRPQLEAMISFAREGDKVVCSDISRIARNTRDLLTIIDELQKERCCFPKSEGVNRHLYPARSIYADRIRSIGAA